MMAKITRKNSVFIGILMFGMIILLVVFFAPAGVQLFNMNYSHDANAYDHRIVIAGDQAILRELKAEEPEIVEVPEEYINPVDRIMSDLNGVIRKYPHHNKGLADTLYNEVKILCWVNTWPSNHKTRAKAVKETWAKRCNKVLFISTKEDPELDTVALPLKDGRQYLWSKIRGAFTYVYKNYFDEYDWFVRADDDTYMIVENLRYMLYQYDPMSPIHLGCKFKPFVKQGYMSGGAGYVLSKEALRRFVEIGIPDPKYCKQEEDEMDDVEIGKCLEKLNVTAGDSRDWNGRGRMFPFIPEQHLVTVSPKDGDFWYWKYVFYPTDDGRNCCSDRTISFHYISPQFMYTMEFLIYELKPFGLKDDEDVLPKKYDEL
ncbi:C1GALT1.2 family protein [Megaselia abdita]